MLRKPLKAKVVVVPKEQVFAFGRVLLWATLHSAATTLGVGAACQVRAPNVPVSVTAMSITGMYWDWEIVHAAFITALLMLVPVPWVYRHTPGWRIVVYGVIYALGLVIWTETIWLLLVEMELKIPVLYVPGLVSMFLFNSNLLVGGFGLVCLTWLICRLVRGPIVQQDGTLCPNCAYSLLGCVEQVCPECGREFTFQELGTTREQFAGKGAGQEAVAERVASPSEAAACRTQD